MYSSGGFYPYEIDNSARLDTNSYYTRTPSSASNRTTWTWSGWVKMPPASSQYTLFFAEPAVTDYAGIIITAGSQLQLINRPTTGVNASLISTQVFRDPSAWYHLVGVWDTTNSTQADRVRLYVNGERVTSFSTSTLPAQNAVSAINSTGLHVIGATVVASSGANNFYNGYITEVNFVDGQALDPTSFGEFKSGVWIPKSYSGTYGTNGFYLDFATRATDPIDASGNGNNWGSVNVVSTDWMLDSPTNNFPTLNPLYGPLITYSEGNLRFYYGGAYAGTAPTMYTGKNQKYYSEELIVALGGDKGIAVIADNEVESIGWIYNGNTYGSLAAGFVMPSYTTGDIIGYAVDGTTNQVQFYKNGVAAGSAWQFSTAKPISFRTHTGYMYGGSDCIANFGQDSSFAGNKTAQGNTDANGIGDFYYAPPAGYLALCTANLPDPAIDPAQDDVPADYFNTVLYTATGNDNLAITGVGFQPDFTWIKSRSSAYSHNVYDAVRGVSKRLQTNLTNAESSPISGVKSFDADGFTLGNDTNDTNFTSGVTYASWNWLAGNGTVSNTDGTIASTVSANQKAGFSIVAYTGNSIAGATVGHGLTQAPDVLIVKNRSGSYGWLVYNSALTYIYYMTLNTFNAASSGGNVWNTDPTNDVFYLNTFPEVNSTSNNYIAYCFHSVEGFSKFGSYIGNGSTDGPFVYTGFRPAFVLLKNASTGNTDWSLYDSARETYNTVDQYLIPNKSNAEASPSAEALDLTSNGFKVRGSWVGMNSNTIIYMAFAEMPFKYSNAR